MKGDRVIVTLSTLYGNSTTSHVFIYGLKRDQDGVAIYASDGSWLIESLGGVADGSTGVVVDEPIKVHRSQLMNYEKAMGFDSNEFVVLLPIFFDKYQRGALVPVENIRVLTGGFLQQPRKK